jgi:hypothetical protein
MKNKFIVAVAPVLFLLFAGLRSPESAHQMDSVSIVWTDSLVGDFSFAKKWSFPLGVEQKGDGKAGCADGGFCPQRCYGMLDKNGLVLKDSVAIFYSLLDTTHVYHTIKCNAWSYQYAGTDFISVKRKTNDTVSCYTLCDVATHSSLQFELANGYCYPKLVLKSIVRGNDAVFLGKKGTISIDRNAWAKGILKAVFHFDFDHQNTHEQNMYWSGIIYAPIN